MTYSHSEAWSWTCGCCGQENASELWLIVDAVARRDLYRRVLDGAIHDMRCRRCLAGTVSVSCPFLLLRRDADPNLVICGPDALAPDHVVGQAANLVRLARLRVDEPLSGPVTVRDSDVPTMLYSVWEDLEKLDQSDPVLQAVLSFLNTTEPAVLRNLLSEAPDLFELSALQLLRLSASSCRAENEDAQADNVQSHLRLIRRITETGADAAFEEYERALAWRARPDVDAETMNLVLEAAQPPMRPEDYGLSIVQFRQALQRIDRERAPGFWCLVQTTLANRLRDDPSGDRSRQIEQAISALQSILDVASPDLDPNGWLGTVTALAHTLQERVEGVRAANFEESVALCEQAFGRVVKDECDLAYAGLLDAYGTAMLDRPGGDRVDNIERAIASYEENLELVTDPALRNVVLPNLARAYLLRIRGDRVENLRQSIEINQQLIDTDAFAADPISLASTAENLAIAYLERDATAGGDGIERAIPLFELSLGVRTREAMPFEWARTTMNLGTAYMERQGGDAAENTRRAVVCLEAAATVLDRTHYPSHWAEVQANLATALSLGAKDPAQRDDARAIAAFQAVLEVHIPQTDPARCRRSAWSLARLCEQRGEWADALAAATTGIAAGAALYRSAYLPSSQDTEMKTNVDLYDLAISVCGRIGTEEADCTALVYAEAARDRLFMDEMSKGQLPPPAGVAPELVEQEEILLRRSRGIQLALAAPVLAPDDERALGAERRVVQDGLEKIWSDMAAVDAGYVALRRGDTPSWEELACLSGSLGPTAALVSLYALPDRILCFVLRAGASSPRVTSCPISQQQLLYRYLLPYRDDVLAPAPGHQPLHSWVELGRELLEPLEPQLEDVDLVYLIPHGYLHTLPLHALTVGGQPLLERRAVVYAPSAGVLARVLPAAGQKGRSGQPALFGYTPATDAHERALFLGEAQALADYFSVAPLVDEAATSDAVRSRTASRLLHLSCHGRFDPTDPLDSGTLLADGLFTCRNWMELSLDTGLITLSACESGFSQTGRGDSISGLARSLLYAGTASCVLTLWEVNAATTLEWMTDFYTSLWDTQGNQVISKAASFQKATIDLRQRYPDPALWAPYILVGSWR